MKKPSLDIYVNYREAPDTERLHGAIVGDPVADYIGFPDIQQHIIEEEAAAHFMLSALERQRIANRQRDEQWQADFKEERRALAYGGSSKLLRHEVASPSEP